jgi:hypothetical protein
MVTNLLATLAVVLNAIAAGALLGSTVGPVPLLLALPPDGYIRAKQFLTPRYDPAMPIIIVATTLLDAVLVLLAPGTARLTFAVAAVVLVLVVVISLTKNVPVNNWELTLDPAALPSDWADRDPRPAWLRWHVIRTALLTLALVVAVAARILLARH